ncbi:PTS sugar transporter subunit IIA, partial [Lacticaseibacillus paracasei]
SDAANKVAIAVLKTRHALAWESLDDQPIRLVFLLVVPTTGRDVLHLKLLSHLSAALTHREVQEKLLHENDADQFKKILEKSGGF